MTPQPRRTRRAAPRPRQPGAPFTVAQAAAVLNLPERSVRALLESGRLVGYREGVGGKLWRIAERDLAAYQTERSGGPAAAPGVVSVRRHLRPAGKGRGR